VVKPLCQVDLLSTSIARAARLTLKRTYTRSLVAAEILSTRVLRAGNHYRYATKSVNFSTGWDLRFTMDGFHVLFNSYVRSFSGVPYGTCFLSVTRLDI